MASPTAAAIQDNLESGTLSFSGANTSVTYPCPAGCWFNYTGASSAEIAGTDASGNPFSLAWDSATAPAGNMALSVSVSSSCGLISPVPVDTGVGVTIDLSGAVLNYHGATSMATVQVIINGWAPLPEEGFAISSLQVQATASNGTVSFLAGLTEGALTVTPMGDTLCGVPQNMPMQVNSTLLSFTS